MTGARYVDGLVWSPEGRLIFADGPADQLGSWRAGEKPAVFREKTGGASGLGYDAQGRLYVCEAKARRVVRIDKKGKLEVLAEQFEGKRFNAPNDIAVRKDGHAYFTDPAFGSQQDRRELDYYGLYYLPPSGPVALAAKLAWRPGGLALHANGRLLYVTNADERSVSVYDVDRRSGALSNPRVLISGIDGVPGGIRLDEVGNLYVAARWVFIYTPAGKRLAQIELPERVANLAFGEGDGQSLFLASRGTVFRVRLRVKGALDYLAP